MFVFSKGKPKTVNLLLENTLNPGGKRGTYRQASGDLKQAFHRKPTGNTKVKGCIWYYASGGNDLGHPAVYPEQLAHDHIYSWSNEGDTVLDCFAGSGTTLKMAKELSRHYIGIEISPEYVTLAEKRLLATSVPLFGQGRGLTPHAADAGDSLAQQAFFTPEVLSTPQGESTPALRR
jgi:site-specific DNA-methyltransferase (adenine-specific)